MQTLELQKMANEVRKGIVTAVHSAKAGHPGGSLSAADIFTYLYFEEMNIDPKNPKSNRGNAGFSDEERGKMRELLASGFVDSFRYLYPDRADAYSWWSYRFKAREKNAGWRIDYFLVSAGYEGHIQDSLIYSEQMGSDHCPVGLLLND